MDETRLGGVNEPTETIGSLMQDCEELSQQISDERERLERFMLETGGASDASDRIQRNIWRKRLRRRRAACRRCSMHRNGRLSRRTKRLRKNSIPPGSGLL